MLERASPRSCFHRLLLHFAASIVQLSHHVSGSAFTLEGSRRPKMVRHARVHGKATRDHGIRLHDATPQFEYCPSDPTPQKNGSITDASSAQCYTAKLTVLGREPVLSHRGGTSDFKFVFNPSWVEASEGTGWKQGLLVRLQNCSGCQCCGCQGLGANSSVLAFVPLLGKDGPQDAPKFGRVSADSVVFGPHDAVDDMGTEDPRVTYDKKTGVYHILYTCFGTGGLHVDMCHASTRNPTISAGWVRHGSVGFGQCSKSGAILLREDGSHFMFWGAPQIRVTQSSDVLHWASPGRLFINSTFWGTRKVEPGPPPLRLSTGDYVFFLNSWNDEWPALPGYQPTWVVLSGSDPTKIIAQATEPLWNPTKEPWMAGEAPHACNKKHVVFIGAAHHTDVQDTFRVYFGGADAVIGTAVVSFAKAAGVICPASAPRNEQRAEAYPSDSVLAKRQTLTSSILPASFLQSAEQSAPSAPLDGLGMARTGAVRTPVSNSDANGMGTEILSTGSVRMMGK